MLAEMNRTSPPGMPNVFLIDIAPSDRDAVLDLIQHQPGIEGTPELIGTVAAKLVTIDGRDVATMDLKGFGRRYRSPRSVTSAGAMPDYVNLVRGTWWSFPAGPPQICVDEDTARILHIEPGSDVRWTISGKDVETRVACIDSIDSVHLYSRVEFVFNSSALAGFPIIYYSSLRAQPSAVPGLQEALYKRFPTVTVVNVADVLQIIQGVVDRISQVVRFISMFAILAGAVILSSSVAGTRFRRMREVVILKTLGATRWRVSRIFSVEFLVLGGVAGLMGSLLAGSFANFLLKRMLDARTSIPVIPILLSVIATALIANAAGWMASFPDPGSEAAADSS